MRDEDPTKKAGDLMTTRQCERCHREPAVTRSQFDNTRIGLRCVKKESAHPLYRKAVKAQHEALNRGDPTFSGIGKPDDL